MHDYKILAGSLIFLFLLLIIPSAFAISLIPFEPSEGYVFNSTNDINFTCNASYEGQVLNLSLYHNLNGTFSKNQTEYYGELPFDSSTSFLCHFNGGLACQAGGNGNPVANDSLSFQAGNLSQGLYVNETGLLKYQTSGNFDRNQGTIEFWIMPMQDVNTYAHDSGYVFYAGDNDNSDINEMVLRLYNGFIRFEITDNSENLYYARKDISLWQTGSWHHVAAVWDLDSNVTDDDDMMSIYADGSNQDFSYNPCYLCDSPISYLQTSSIFSIGSNKRNSSQANATIDELRISSSVRSASEINQSYQAGFGNYSSVSKSWSFYNVTDGSYIWRCIAYDNDSQENSSSVMNFYVDMGTPPSVNAILLSPNSSDDIDPGVTINFTSNISDPSGVDTVIFQWKKVGDWSNITMAFNASSGLYENASFQTGLVSGVYLYRIWSNDTKGNSGYTSTQNVTSAWDFTWTRSPASFGTVSGLINSISSVGMLQINNTGDDTLNFTIFKSWPLPVYYNGSEESNFYVADHTTVTINITANFSQSDSENDMLITINASHPTETASPLSLATNATINSYSGGPYLSVSITEYTSMVSQSQSFNLSARVKNIGNETAEDAWLNWSLPAGWTNTSGNATQMIGNLSSGSSFTSNLTVIVDPSSAGPGTFIIYANSSCSQNVSGLDYKTVGMECNDSDGVCGYGCSYVNDNDCGIPTGAPGTGETVFIGGGGGGEKTQYLMGLEVPSSFDIQKGDKKTLRVRITNGGKNTNLTSIYLLVTGYPLTQIKMEPSAITRLGYNQTGFFDLEFFAPNYTRYGIHNITITAKGSGSIGASKNFTDVEKTAKVSMVVHSSRENETMETLAEAEKAVQEMAEAGLNTGKAKALLEQAKAQISSWDYDTGLETSKQVLELRDRTFHITGMISQVEEGVKEAGSFGIQAPESKKMAELSKSALQREDYAKAEERANSAVSAFVIEGQWLENMRFVYANWYFIISGSALLAGASYLAYRKSLKGRIRKKIALAAEEEKAIRKLMEKAQEEMYNEKTLSKLEYHKLMSEHESRLAKIRKRKAQLTARLIRLEKRSVAISNFRKQEDALRKEIQDIQKKYYEQGSVSKSSYHKNMDELREELAESIKNMDLVMEKRKGQAGLLVPAIIILSVILTSLVLAQVDDRQAALSAMDKAQGWISEMEQMGFPANRVNDTLNEAKLLFSKGFYQGAESIANDVEGLKNRAISIDKKIDEVETFLYQASSMGINVSQPQGLFDQALDTFKTEDYERAEELLSQASAKIEELESDYSMKRVSEGVGLEGLLKKIQDNMLMVLIAAAILISVVIAGIRVRRRRKTRGRIGRLDRKADRLNSMIKDLQLKYFQKGEMSESEYRNLMERYRKRIATARRRKLALEGTLKKQEKTQPKDS